MEAATPLALVRGSGVCLVHAIQSTLNDVDWVILGVRVLLVVDICEDTGLDAVARSSAKTRIIAFERLVSQISMALG